jgi:hypothetical protein
VAELYEEYRFRRLFSETHEGFLNTPRNTVAWLLRIDHEVKQAEAEAIKRERERLERGNRSAR